MFELYLFRLALTTVSLDLSTTSSNTLDSAVDNSVICKVFNFVLTNSLQHCQWPKCAM